MRRLILWLSSILVLLLAVGGVVLYTAPVGSGEYRTAPNGQYCARATTYVQRRLFAPTRQYQIYAITTGSCEQEEGSVIWYAKYEPGTDLMLDYGIRGVQFVTWAATSDRVIFLLGGDRSLAIPVP